jgi:charged multivesicular body protein 5
VGEPSFMVDEVPSFIDEPPAKVGEVKEAAT